MKTTSPPASFRFLDLPTEIRIQIYRNVLHHNGQYVIIKRNGYSSNSSDSGPINLAIVFVSRLTYSEAMPLFLSDNRFFNTGSRREYKWLRRMRPEGRSELRNVTLKVSSEASSYEYSFYNTLSLCTQMHLTLEVYASDLPKWTQSSKKDQRNMHGFAAATSGALPDLCQFHQHCDVPGEEVTPRRELVKCIEELLQRYRAPCIGKCRAHKGREGTHTHATVHIAFYPGCYACE